MISVNTKKNIKTSVVAFLVGFVVAGITGGYFAYTEIQKIKADYQPAYSESLQWIIDNPEYADVVKANHDNYMNAAENAFMEGLKMEDLKE